MGPAVHSTSTCALSLPRRMVWDVNGDPRSRTSAYTLPVSTAICGTKEGSKPNNSDEFGRKMYAPDACDEQAGSRFVSVSGYGVQPPTDELYQPQVNFREVVVRDARFSIVVRAFVAVQNVNLNTPLSTIRLSPSRVT